MIGGLLQLSSTNIIASKGLGLSGEHEISCKRNSMKKSFVPRRNQTHPGLSPNCKTNLVEVKGSVPCNGLPNGSQAQALEGIGIVKFLEEKVFFIIGATGFLAKVLIEKLLRNIPDVGKIYVLIKAKNREDALKRLKNEIINSEIFKWLEQTHGKSYEEFMLSKLIPVAGNICESNLGLDQHSAAMILQDVHIIVNSAANTNFRERYDVALDTNTMGVGRVVAFANSCKKLNLLLQISTAYVNGQRQGRIMERPFSVGETIFIADGLDNPTPPLDVEAEVNLARRSAKESITAEKMKELGIQRARKYGWQNAYEFTKAMGEMMLGNVRGEAPVVIIRPSIVESAYRDPSSGWIEKNRMMDPFVIQYGKGQLPGFPGDANGVLDIIPADMVANVTLAAIAKHGITRKPEISVYQVASSAVNPFMMRDLAYFSNQHFTRWPCLDVEGRPISIEPFRFFQSMDDFSSHISRETIHKFYSSMDPSPNEDRLRKIKSVCRRIVAQAMNLASVYGPYMSYGARFDNSNTSLLLQSMSEEEREAFYFDVRSIDWEDYICNVHIPGLRRYVMKENSRAAA